MAVDQRALPSFDPSAAVTPVPEARALTVLFGVTAFLGAALLFLVEPLVAKLLLPAYGGSATVWSTSSLFFQVLLLAAYGYCHLATTRLSRRRQPKAHLLLLLLPLVVLPLAVPADAAPGPTGSPALWLLRTLAVLVGLPFVVVATTGPLLQRWYSWSGSRRADDPYFLFAASNLGSAVGLLAYPFVVESRLTLAEQRGWWSAAYVAFLLLTAGCGLAVLRRGDHTAVSETPAAPVERVVRPPSRQIAVWAALAFLPSTLMLGVTAHLSTDVAAIPLLWVVPLAIYLGSFVLAFARSSRAHPARAVRLAVALGAVELLVTLSGVGGHILVGITTSLLTLAAVAYAAHARLATLRPRTEHLTAFYLVVAAGGALGGLLNGLVAPMVLDSVLEYPLALAAVPLLLVGLGPFGGRLAAAVRLNPVRAACLVVATAVVATALRPTVVSMESSWLVVVPLVVVLGFGWLLTQHPVLAVAGVVALCAPNVWMGQTGTIEQSRTFYGTYRVLDTNGKHTLMHGTTVHGTEFMDPARRLVPTAYYAPSGPLGDLFDIENTAPRRLDQVGVVGLGAGTVAAYGRPGQTFTYFEIDPEVVRIAHDRRLFHYLSDTPATVRTVVGDGRMNVAASPRGSFDLLVLDAFSSDSIPVHLLTREAVRTYAARLRPGGALAFHITNRVFDLEPVMASTVRSLGWHGVIRTSTSTVAGATRSRWVVISPAGGVADELVSRSGWRPVRDDRIVQWTDDYSSVLSVLK